MKKMLCTLITKEIQIKTTLKYYLIPLRPAHFKNTKTTSIGMDFWEKEPTSTASGNVNCSNLFGKQ